MGLGVALFVLYSGISLAKETISPLLGEAASPELRQDILKEMTADPRILGHHDLMVHDYGPGQRFGSIHVEMDCREDSMACHNLIDKLEHNCLEKLGVHMVIHYDPISVDDPVLAPIRKIVEETLQNIHSAITYHDLHLDEKELHLDVALPSSVRKSQVTEAIKNALAEHQSVSDIKITFDLLDS
jgi:Co/Zn/Cd efflux system component